MADMQPRPTQFSTADYGLSPLQQEYIKTLQNQPSSSEMYGKARESLGIGEQEKILSGMNRSVLDLEGKIKGVSDNVDDRTRDFLVTEAQKERRINIEEAPLRDQYLELLRRREGQSGILSSLNGQLSEQMGYAKEDSGRTLTALEQMLKFQADNKTASSANSATDMFTAALNKLNGNDTQTTGQTSVLDENTSNSLFSSVFSENTNEGNTMSGVSELFNGINQNMFPLTNIGTGIGQKVRQSYLEQSKKRTNNQINRKKGGK